MSLYIRKLVIGVTGILTSTVAISYLVEKMYHISYLQFQWKVYRRGWQKAALHLSFSGDLDGLPFLFSLRHCLCSFC